MFAKMLKLGFVAIILGVFNARGKADVLPDGRGKSPLMGWRTWNVFHRYVNQTLMEQGERILQNFLERLA